MTKKLAVFGAALAGAILLAAGAASAHGWGHGWGPGWRGAPPPCEGAYAPCPYHAERGMPCPTPDCPYAEGRTGPRGPGYGPGRFAYPDGPRADERGGRGPGWGPGPGWGDCPRGYDHPRHRWCPW